MSDDDLAVEIRSRITFPDGHADVWPLFHNARTFGRVVAALAEPLAGAVTKVAGIEARGFLLGAAVATRLEVGFVAIRKAGGLFPGPKLTTATGRDYRGIDHTLRLQRGSCGAGDTVALVDDWCETGSQANAARELIVRSGARYAGLSIVIDELDGPTRAALAPCHAVIRRDAFG